MYSMMYLKFISVWKNHIKMGAFKWFISSVHSYMYHTIIIFLIMHDSFLVFNGSLSCMHFQMYSKNIPLLESLLTMDALVWFLNGVYSQMYLYVNMWVRVKFVATGAQNWLLGIVCSQCKWAILCNTSSFSYEKYLSQCLLHWISYISPQYAPLDSFQVHCFVKKQSHTYCVDMVSL